MDKAVARALQLDDVERAHLFHLARTANATRTRVHRRAPSQPTVRPSVHRLLDAMTEVAAFLRNGRLDVLAANPLGYALYSPMRSEEFRDRWAAHDVTEYRSGVQPFRHPPVGDLALEYTALDLPADPGQVVVAYTAQPGSPSHEALRRLAVGAATSQQDDAGQNPLDQEEKSEL